MLQLAWKFLRRDWRAGEIRILIAAIVIAVAAVASIGMITDRLNRAMIQETSQFLGADRVFSSSREINPQWLDEARQRELQVSEATSFSTVAVSNGKFQLTQILAIDEFYPLRGNLVISDEAFTAGAATVGGPASGEVWVDARLLGLLEAKVGSTLEIGESNFLITGVIQDRPGKASEVFNVAPTVMINRADVAATNVIQPGSRVRYQGYFAGGENTVSDYSDWLAGVKEPSQRLLGGKEGTPSLESALTRAEQYLGLAALVAVVLAGVAIAVTTNRYCRRHYDYSAILRCLGYQRRQVQGLYAIILLIIGIASSLLGALLGFLIQEGVILAIRDLLPQHIPAARFAPVATGLITGLVALLGFALPAFLRMGKVTPLRVLRRDLEPLPSSGWLIYGLALGSLALLMWWQSGNWILVAVLLVGGVLAVLVMMLAAWLVLKAGLLIGRRFTGAFNFGVRQLERQQRANLGQILSFGLALLVMLSAWLLRDDLLAEWRSQLPEDVPNHFLVNVQPEQVKPLTNLLAENDVSMSGIYPMVRGRLVEINNQPAREAVPETGREDGSLRRELNLTWTEALPNANQITDGAWHPAEQGNSLSIESGLAERLALAVGDSLTFDIGGTRLTAPVASIREVQWDSFQPNFFIIFSPGALDGFPSNSITSFHIAAEKKPLLNQILSEMPTITIIELDAIIEQVQSILEQVTSAVEFVMLFVLLAGVAVLLATLEASMDERQKTSALLRTLGASRSYIRTSLLTEFLFLGLLAGLLAALGTELIAFGLYERVFDMPFRFHPWVWVVGPLAGILIIGTAGWLGSRKVVNVPPVTILRRA